MGMSYMLGSLGLPRDTRGLPDHARLLTNLFHNCVLDDKGTLCLTS
jgi:hypothetical protein